VSPYSPQHEFQLSLWPSSPDAGVDHQAPEWYVALCEDCGLPIERAENGRWYGAEPLVSRRNKAA